MGYVTAPAHVGTSQDSQICISGVYLATQHLKKRAWTVPPIISIWRKIASVVQKVASEYCTYIGAAFFLCHKGALNSRPFHPPNTKISEI